MPRLIPVFALAAVFSGCLQAQRPVRIQAPNGEAPVGRVARALAEQGHTPEKVDLDAGILLTRWRRAGVCSHPGATDPAEAVLSRRHVVTVSPSNVTVLLESQCCLRQAVMFGAPFVHEPCVEREGVTRSEQRDLDELGRRLERTLGSS